MKRKTLAEREREWRRLYPEAFVRKPNRKRVQRKRNRHHLIPRSRGGSMSLNNLLYIDIERHRAWHDIFGNATAEEVLNLLERVVRAKKNQSCSRFDQR